MVSSHIKYVNKPVKRSHARQTLARAMSFFDHMCRLCEDQISPTANWLIIEINIAVVCACLTALKPLSKNSKSLPVEP